MKEQKDRMPERPAEEEAKREEARQADKQEPDKAAGAQTAQKDAADGVSAVEPSEKPAEEPAEENLKKQLIAAEQKALEAELRALRLEGQIDELNQQYTKKLGEKALDAQRQIDRRLAQLQDEFALKGEENKKYAASAAAKQLVEVAQSFAMVMQTSQRADGAIKQYAQGFQIVSDMLEKALVKLGIERMNIQIGDAFDHATMEALDSVASELPKDHVAEIVKDGYRLHDKVIVHALVKTAE